jgi:hypothetical protein
MSQVDLFHSNGITQIVVLIQQSALRSRGQSHSHDTVFFKIAALGEDGKAFRGNYVYKYWAGGKEELSGSVSEVISNEEHARLVAERGTMESPKPFNPKAPRFCISCGERMRKYENRNGTVWKCCNGHSLR